MCASLSLPHIKYLKVLDPCSMSRHELAKEIAHAVFLQDRLSLFPMYTQLDVCTAPYVPQYTCAHVLKNNTTIQHPDYHNAERTCTSAGTISTTSMESTHPHRYPHPRTYTHSNHQRHCCENPSQHNACPALDCQLCIMQTDCVRTSQSCPSEYVKIPQAPRLYAATEGSSYLLQMREMVEYGKDYDTSQAKHMPNQPTLHLMSLPICSQYRHADICASSTQQNVSVASVLWPAHWWTVPAAHRYCPAPRRLAHTGSNL